ncbi:RagB/SusD family nutrient uptake outer membrane protein [Sphingobacterium sp. PU5-4]|uniref:RagB/SusD family nutrient uptake outer membrane protein n=1 Tax=Sphingobacterium tenebrionis TaxID=3111775 RepID=A0ABU8I3C6_9SPHI
MFIQKNYCNQTPTMNNLRFRKPIKPNRLNWKIVLFSSNGRTFNERMYFFPIPIEDLVLNKNLEQNPGWEKAK